MIAIFLDFKETYNRLKEKSLPKHIRLAVIHELGLEDLAHSNKVSGFEQLVGFNEDSENVVDERINKIQNAADERRS